MDRRTWTDQQLKAAIETSISISDTLRKIGLAVRPGNFQTVKKYITKLELDTSHFLGQGHGRSIPPQKRSLKEILVEDSTYAKSSTVKKRLIKEGLLVEQCALCSLKGTWNERPLVLVLDHVNGHRTDYRIENLRLLCPNCNSQQPTFCRGYRGLGASRVIQR